MYNFVFGGTDLAVAVGTLENKKNSVEEEKNGGKIFEFTIIIM